MSCVKARDLLEEQDPAEEAVIPVQGVAVPAVLSGTGAGTPSSTQSRPGQ